MSEATAETKKKGSALGALRAMSKKEKVDPTSTYADTVNDVAVAGAKRVKTTVQLGLDIDFAPTAKAAAEAKEALKRAEKEFEVHQAAVRDYGAEKRQIWNKSKRSLDTTVAVPYEVDVPGGQKETRHVAVVCSNKYSVRKDTIEQVRGDLGDTYDRLFEEDRKKVLKPNCEEIVRGLLGELGMEGEELDTAMDSLFEEEVKIKTKKEYEREVEAVPEGLRDILDQAVTRAQPALKF